MGKLYFITAQGAGRDCAVYLFRKRFTIAPGEAAGLRLRAEMSADSRYKLYVNGGLASVGPCKGTDFTTYCDAADLSGYLVDGENEILAKVLYLDERVGRAPSPMPLLAVTRRAQPTFLFRGVLERDGDGAGGGAGTIGDAIAEAADGADGPGGGASRYPREILTDATWEACEDLSERIEPNAYALFASLNERVGMICASGGGDGGIEAAAPPEPAFRAAVETEDCHFDYGSSGPWGELDSYVLSPRPIPPPYIGGLVPLTQGFTVAPREKRSLVLDAGRYTTAYVFASVKGGGAKVELTYAECYEFEETPGGDGENTENGGGPKRTYKRRRDDDAGFLRGDSDILRPLPGGEELRYESYWFKTFRYIRVDVQAGDEPFVCAGISYRETHYPLPIAASFSCSDPAYERIWGVSQRTLLCCMHETFEDCPYFEQLQYIMDTGIQAQVAYALSHDHALQKKALRDFAESRLPSGMLQSRYPSMKKQVIPGFALHYIYMLENYAVHTGDLATVAGYAPVADGVLAWFASRLTPRGLVGPTGYWPYLDWVDGWESGVPYGVRDEPLAVYSMMYAYALECAARLAERAWGRPEAAPGYRARAEAMRGALLATCYDEGRRMFRDIPGRELFSEHGQVWAAMCGLAGKTDLAAALSPASGLPKCSLSMRFYTFRALEAAGRYDLAPGLLEIWRRMLDLGCTTWVEDSDLARTRSECHAWSAAPAYEFARVVLGVRPEWGRVVVSPNTGCGLARASGAVPTRFGDVEVSWGLKGGAAAPAEADIDVRLVNAAPGARLERQGGVWVVQ